MTNLDAVRRNDVTESVVVVAQELREVVQQNQKDAERASVESVDRLGQLGVAQERRQELELEVEEANQTRERHLADFLTPTFQISTLSLLSGRYLSHILNIEPNKVQPLLTTRI